MTVSAAILWPAVCVSDVMNEASVCDQSTENALSQAFCALP